mmetsp:Transcript_77289/g.202804  ORF Transcript_77289/g.202804 Transcript_77289/m.202804 type:complete len:529 (+) Transcript_77289:52-1638(+)
MDSPGYGKSKEYLPLTKSGYGLGLKWDNLDGVGIDVDLQAVLVDDKGHIIDAVYYNNMTALQGAIGLISDDSTGDANGYDEQIWIKLKNFMPHVKLVIFVVAVYNDRNLDQVDNGQVVLLEEGRPMKSFKLESSNDGGADVVAMMKLELDGTWAFFEVNEPAEGGSHFLDILEPTIGDLIRKEIPHAPKVQKVSFVMEKGARACLPQTSKLTRLSVGVGGNLRPMSQEEVDMEIAAVFFSKDGQVFGAVDAFSDGMCGVEHTSDLSDRFPGDDELITIDLAQIPEQVDRIFLVLTVSGGTFGLVRQAYARIADQTATELVRYDMDGGRQETGLIIGQLLRAVRRRWTFEALGCYYSSGCGTWKGALDQMSKIVHGQNLKVPGSGALKKQVAFEDEDQNQDVPLLSSSTRYMERRSPPAAVPKASAGAARIRPQEAPPEGAASPESGGAREAAAPECNTPGTNASPRVRRGCVRLQGSSNLLRKTMPDASDTVDAECKDDEEAGHRLRPCGAVCPARSGFFGACAGMRA